MERLTFEGNFCDIAQCSELPCKYDGNCTQKQVWERLKQFEDAFGTPEKAGHVKLAFMGRTVYEIKEFDGVPLARLIELAEADKDGRVVVLPCKVGDTIYAIEQVLRSDGVHSKIAPIQITGIGGNALNKVWLVSMFGRHEIRISPSEFGINVFTTREEAEKALQEMEGKKDGNETSM